MLNHVTMMGRLCVTPELRHTQSNISVTTFRIAVERNYVGQDDERATDFFDVTAWRGTAEIICKYFGKGRMIAIDGRLETNSWTDRDGNNRVSIGIVAESVFFADSKRVEEEPARGKTANRSKNTNRTKGNKAA